MPTLSTAPFSRDELILLVTKYREYGPKWKLIANHFEGRTDIALKNAWVHLVRTIRRNDDSDGSVWNCILCTLHKAPEPPTDEAAQQLREDLESFFSFDEGFGDASQGFFDFQAEFNFDY
jgi:hypothetical protein